MSTEVVNHMTSSSSAAPAPKSTSESKVAAAAGRISPSPSVGTTSTSSQSCGGGEHLNGKDLKNSAEGPPPNGSAQEKQLVGKNLVIDVGGDVDHVKSSVPPPPNNNPVAPSTHVTNGHHSYVHGNHHHHHHHHRYHHQHGTVPPQVFPPTTLYVGDLDHEVDEQALWEKFSSCGPIYSIRVCRDFLTCQSLGYGYVNFQESSDAEAAMRYLNYEVLLRRPMRIMWSEKDPSVRRSGVGNIFIKNLNKTITTKELHDTFNSFGRILSCKIMYDESGRSKGFGFIHFDNQKSADDAIEKVNGMLVKDKKVYVAMFKPKVERLNEMDGREQRFNNVYIKNFDKLLDDSSLKALFDRFGPIISAKVMVDDQNQSKGFGFVSFHDPDHARDAVQAMNGNKLDETHELFVARAQKKEERSALLRSQYEKIKRERFDKSRGINLYVKHFNNTVDDDALYKIFAKFGTITSAKVMRHENGLSREFGFVCFSQPDEATRALTELNGKIMYDGKPLYVALSQSKEERRANLRINFGRRAARPFRGFPNLPGQQQQQFGHPGAMAPHAYMNPMAAMYSQNQPPHNAYQQQPMANLSPIHGMMNGGSANNMYAATQPTNIYMNQQQQQQNRQMFPAPMSQRHHQQHRGFSQYPPPHGMGGRSNYQNNNNNKIAHHQPANQMYAALTHGTNSSMNQMNSMLNTGIRAMHYMDNTLPCGHNRRIAAPGFPVPQVSVNTRRQQQTAGNNNNNNSQYAATRTHHGSAMNGALNGFGPQWPTHNGPAPMQFNNPFAQQQQQQLNVQRQALQAAAQVSMAAAAATHQFMGAGVQQQQQQAPVETVQANVNGDANAYGCGGNGTAAAIYHRQYEPNSQGGGVCVNAPPPQQTNHQ